MSTYLTIYDKFNVHINNRYVEINEYVNKVPVVISIQVCVSGVNDVNDNNTMHKVSLLNSLPRAYVNGHWSKHQS